MDYLAAGFQPDGFWRLTFRQYDLHMTGAARRIEREAEMFNRLAYNGAALTGAAFGGKFPDYDKAFSPREAGGAAQSAEALEANLMALARAWGAVTEG